MEEDVWKSLQNAIGHKTGSDCFQLGDQETEYREQRTFIERVMVELNHSSYLMIKSQAGRYYFHHSDEETETLCSHVTCPSRVGR